MKKALWCALGVVGLGGGSLGLMAFQYEAVIKPNTQVGIVPVGGLSKVEAARRLRLWWESEKGRELTVSVANGSKPPLRVTLGKLGMTLDDTASVADLPMQEFGEAAMRVVGAGDNEKKTFDLKFKNAGSSIGFLDQYVRESIGDPRPAQVKFEGGKIVRLPEISGFAVDKSKLSAALVQGFTGDGQVLVPISEAPKKLPDSELAKIEDVVSEFSTRFPTAQGSRCQNIQLAAGKINGKLLMPGEVFSFNETVGKRTIEDGYRLAGVYKNGKHDLGIGGGICQVSGTLYNTVLYANLKIVQRRNHSMPVAYLAVGRDATVDYGSVDLQFENSGMTPIAISSTYTPGRLTFRVLGKKDPTLKVEIVTSGHRSWSKGVKTVVDRSLRPGSRKIVEKGSLGHSVNVTRVVYQNGKVVKRESLGQSYYNGGTRIVAIGPAAARRPAAAAASSAPATTAPPATVPPTPEQASVSPPTP